MIPGRRVKVPHWIEGDYFVVRVEVDALVPDEDDSEPCFEPAAVKWIDHLQTLADANDLDELAKHGTVYVRRSA